MPVRWARIAFETEAGRPGDEVLSNSSSKTYPTSSDRKPQELQRARPFAQERNAEFLPLDFSCGEFRRWQMCGVDSQNFAAGRFRRFRFPALIARGITSAQQMIVLDTLGHAESFPILRANITNDCIEQALQSVEAPARSCVLSLFGDVTPLCLNDLFFCYRWLSIAALNFDLGVIPVNRPTI